VEALRAVTNPGHVNVNARNSSLPTSDFSWDFPQDTWPSCFTGRGHGH